MAKTGSRLHFFSGRFTPSVVMLTGCAVVIASAIMIFTPPLAQDQAYHDFADQRTLLGTPHALNVLSNIFLCLVGVWGGLRTIALRYEWPAAFRFYLVFFVGVFFTGLGSAYYHLSPDNATLFWDRLPLTVTFMTFTCIVLNEQYGTRVGNGCFPWLLAAGIVSAIYWAWADDLRPYILVQFLPLLALPFIIFRFRGRGTLWLWLTLLFYVAAKLFELSDHAIYELTDKIVSGHTLKHVAAALGALMMVGKVSSISHRRHRGGVHSR